MCEYTVKVYNKEELITEIKVKGANVTFTNHKKCIWNPFGEKEEANINDLFDYYKSRCFPEYRRNLKDILRGLDLNFYDEEYICRKTHGTQFDDFVWLQFSDEPQVTYNEIKLR